MYTYENENGAFDNAHPRKGSAGMTILVFLLAIVVLTISVIIGAISYVVGTLNSEVRLRNGIVAQDQSNTAQYDKMWKIMSEQAGIAGQYAKDFKEIYPELIAGRYQSGGGLMKWIQEHNPEFNTALYQKVMVAIESERNATKQGFDKVLDLKREHDNLLDYPISGFVLKTFGGKTEKTSPVIVTSTDTNTAFATGTDDRILGKE